MRESSSRPHARNNNLQRFCPLNKPKAENGGVLPLLFMPPQTRIIDARSNLSRDLPPSSMDLANQIDPRPTRREKTGVICSGGRVHSSPPQHARSGSTVFPVMPQTRLDHRAEYLVLLRLSGPLPRHIARRRGNIRPSRSLAQSYRGPKHRLSKHSGQHLPATIPRHRIGTFILPTSRENHSFTTAVLPSHQQQGALRAPTFITY